MRVTFDRVSNESMKRPKKYWCQVSLSSTGSLKWVLQHLGSTHAKWMLSQVYTEELRKPPRFISVFNFALSWVFHSVKKKSYLTGFFLQNA